MAAPLNVTVQPTPNINALKFVLHPLGMHLSGVIIALKPA